MSNSRSLDTSFIDVMICVKNEVAFIRDLSDITLEIIFNAFFTSMNVGWKYPIVCNNSRPLHWWQFYLHCGIEETGSPCITCIVHHPVLWHPSEHGTG